MIKELMIKFTRLCIWFMELPFIIRITFSPLYILTMIIYSFIYYIIYFICSIKYGKSEWKKIHYNYIIEYYKDFLKDM